MKRPPRVADVVHYVDDDMDDNCFCCAAIVVAVSDGYKRNSVDMVVLSMDDQIKPYYKVPYSEIMVWGDWHYADECPLYKQSEQTREEITHE